MSYEISYVDVWSVGKIVALLYGAMGIVSWLFVPLFLFLPAWATGSEAAGWGRGLLLGFFLLAPLFYWVMGLLFGLVGGLVYNLAARTMGGLVIRLTAREAV